VKGIFVIKSRRAPVPAKPRQYYRCNAVFDRLMEWLRKQGVNGPKPLHTLRKEYGSLLTRSYGIHAASRALRHADLRTTSEHYSDSTAQVTPGLGASWQTVSGRARINVGRESRSSERAGKIFIPSLIRV
jgi:integrase